MYFKDKFINPYWRGKGMGKGKGKITVSYVTNCYVNT